VYNIVFVFSFDRYCIVQITTVNRATRYDHVIIATEAEGREAFRLPYLFKKNPVHIPHECGDKLRSLVSTTKEVQGDKEV
jgi:hypothetical protein